MVIVNVNIVELWRNGYIVCVTTNGYVKKNGQAVMGRGNAKAMADVIPVLPKALGQHIVKNGNSVGFIYDRVIAFPVKPAQGSYNQVLNRVKHLYSPGQIVPGFHCKADPDIIKRSALQLVALINQSGISEEIYLPLPGVGNGELKIQDIKNALKILNDHVTFVRWK